jgi:hypothetical protein
VVPLVRFDSYSVDYYEVEDKYFKEYPFRINVSREESRLKNVWVCGFKS